MTKEEIESVLAGQVKLTRAVAFAMADIILSILRSVSDEGPGDRANCPTCGQGFALGYKTAKRVCAARVAEIPLP